MTEIVSTEVLKWLGQGAAALLIAFLIYLQYRPPAPSLERDRIVCPFTATERDHIRDTKHAVGRLEEERHELTRVLADINKSQVEVVHVVERTVLAIERIEERLHARDLTEYARRRST